MTFNLTENGAAALDRLPGRDKADRINRALRVAAIVEGLMTAERTLTILRDGKPHEVHIL
jgi:hypothetical protein